MRNLGEMFHTKYSSEWQLYQPVKICNRNVSTYWSDFPKNKDITVISDHEYGYILQYIEIALCILRLHLELAITFTNYNQMKHDISYEKYEISLKRNFLSMRNVLLPKQRITAYCIRKILKELFWEISLLKIFL